ncbi:MAG: VOC family protein [Sedimentisphaerales bacterium]|nr:VOC family protein [Sedimentisphaerales bacterium]
MKSENVEETAHWYCRIFGGKVTFQGEYSGSKVFYVDINGMKFIIFGKLENEDEPDLASLNLRYGLDHFGFAVDDIEKTISELRAENVKILEDPITIRPGLRIVYIEGPDKVRIELSERH